MGLRDFFKKKKTENVKKVNIKKIIVDGKQYDSIEDVPAEFQEMLKDEDHNGVPDIVQKAIKSGNIVAEDESRHKELKNEVKKSTDKEEFLNKIGEKLKNYKIHEKEGAKKQLRGTYKDFPVKINFSYFHVSVHIKVHVFPFFLEIFYQSGIHDVTKNMTELFGKSILENFESIGEEKREEIIRQSTEMYAKMVYQNIMDLHWDPGKVPVKKDVEDPWSGDDQARIFLGKGIFVEGPDEAIEVNILFFNSMQESVQQKILETMEFNKISRLKVNAEDIEFEISESILSKAEKPIDLIFEILDVLQIIAQEFEHIEISEIQRKNKSETKKIKRFRLISCKYCTSKYPLTEKARCPNCGASYT
jgi:hypothetical protein